jgi:hypothetical protein
VKRATTEGGVEKGYALMQVETVKGTDLCFVAYRPGTHSAGGLSTDAQQAFVVTEGGEVRSAYLGGGSNLSFGKMKLTRSAPGLAYVERTVAGTYFVGNPSPKEAEITIEFGALKGMQANALNVAGDRSGEAKVNASGESITISLPANSRVEFAKPGAPSAREHKLQMLRQKQAEAEAAAAKAKAEAQARSDARASAAQKSPAPARTSIVVQAEAFTAQGGGEATVTDTKAAAIGKALSGWNGAGHWIEWVVDAPADGFYNLSACYCIQSTDASREVSINGQVQEPASPMALPTTGGWSNGTDDWRLATAMDSVTGQPLLIQLKAGKNTIRLTNIDGNASNMDYLLITSPDSTRDRLKP